MSAEEQAFPCPTCGGEGGGGDDRCAVVLCADCDGSGVHPQVGDQR